MSKTVFISHASEDRVTGERICAALEGEGIKCFIAPRDIEAGEQWPEGLMRGISGCRVLLLLFSSHSNRSGMVIRELEKAASLMKAVLPVRLEDVHPTQKISFFIGLEHWLDASKPPFDPHLAPLVVAVRRLLVEPGAAVPEHEAPRRVSDSASPAVPRAGTRPVGFGAMIGVGAVAALCGVGALWAAGYFASKPTPPPSVSPVVQDTDLDAIVERRASAQQVRERLLQIARTPENADLLDKADLAWRMAEEFNAKDRHGRAVAQYSAVIAAAEELRKQPVPPAVVAPSVAKGGPADPKAGPGVPEPASAPRPKAGAAPQQRLGDSVSNSIGMKLVYLPAGRVTLGSPISEPGRNPSDDERTADAILSKPFWIAATETTRGQFKQFVEEAGFVTQAEREGFTFGWQEGAKDNPRIEGGSWKDPGFAQEWNHPVVAVSWHDAVVFCEWLSKKENRKYRLPTEAEWEYACRAGSTTPFATGSTISTDDANYNGELPYANGATGLMRHATTAASAFPPNSWGLYDMHGNVWEWCSDWYSPQYGEGELRDPRGPSEGDHRVRRGGSFISPGSYVRSAFRSKGRPERSFTFAGFRVVMEHR